MLAQMGGYSLDNEDAHLLTGAIQQGGEDCYSALWLAARGKYYDLPSELLISTATERGEKQELASVYASILLINSEGARTVPYDDWPSRLAPCWRAEAALKHPRFLRNVVNEIDHSLESLLHFVMQSEIDRSLLLPAAVSVEPFDMSKVGQYSISQSAYEKSLHLVSPESTAGGLAQTNITPSIIRERLAFNRDEAVRQMKELSDEAIKVLHQRSMEHNTCWSATEFPWAFWPKWRARTLLSSLNGLGACNEIPFGLAPFGVACCILSSPYSYATAIRMRKKFGRWFIRLAEIVRFIRQRSRSKALILFFTICPILNLMKCSPVRSLRN